MPRVKIIEQGISRYPFSLISMDIAHESVSAGEEECIFITEHYPLYSAGKSFKESDFLAPPTIPTYYPRRGGRVTVHSPGQLVIYPIINIRARGIMINEYVNVLERWIVTVLNLFGIANAQSHEKIGVWVDNEKIGFIGISVQRGVTSHGLCLNVSNDLSLFDAIIPCGLSDMKITSIERILDRKIALTDVAKAFTETMPFH
jgi:lipoyl(octanoyl) transferase